MAKLAEYWKKRRFERTLEPRGGAMRGGDSPTFVVQKHAASKLHYDLRLEVGGVLRSWALPQGPSLDPAQRRLAVETEDHPLEYAAFEGVIPEGEYGAGAMIVWDRGDFAPLEEPEAALAAGALKFRLAGGKLRGGWMLKRMPKRGAGAAQWLLIKERDAEADRENDILADAPESALSGRRIEALAEESDAAAEAPPALAGAPGARPAPPPPIFEPMLPSPEALPPDGADWIHEIKFDGHRTLAWIDQSAAAPIRFITRRGLDWTERYAALKPAFAPLSCARAVIDGEVAVLDARGGAALDLLQEALREGWGERLVYFAFDLVHLDGYDLTETPLIERKAHLKALLRGLGPGARLQYSDHLDDGRALYAQMCQLELEGVVSKRRWSRYVFGRTQSWIKAKRHDVGRFEVVGFTVKTPKVVAALILAEPGPDGALTYAGRVGSGFSNEVAKAFFERFAPEAGPAPTLAEPPKLAASSGKAHWRAPDGLIAEIAYRGRTSSNMVRQPAFLRLEEPPTPTRAADDAAPLKPKRVTDQALAAIRLTNPDRRMFGGEETKLDIALFYARVGDWMLEDLLDRPVSLLRCPTGDGGDCFHQRHGFKGLPDGVERVVATTSDGEETDYITIRSVEGFLALPQLGVVEFHPWACRIDRLDRPDRLIFDLDPAEDVGWPALVDAALALRERLEACGLASFVRTTGGAGLHLVTPLQRRHGWDEVKRFAAAFAAACAADAPRVFTTTIAKAGRRGRILLDIGRAGASATTVASYSLRARQGLPAATPLFWHELAAARAGRLNFSQKTLPQRLARLAEDPWAGLVSAATTISRKARKEAGLKDA